MWAMLLVGFLALGLSGAGMAQPAEATGDESIADTTPVLELEPLPDPTKWVEELFHRVKCTIDPPC